MSSQLNIPGPGEYNIEDKNQLNKISSKYGSFGPIPKRRLNLSFKSPAPNAYNLSSLKIKDRQDFNRAPFTRAFLPNIAIKSDEYEQQQLPAPCDYQRIEKSTSAKVGMAVFKSNCGRLFDLPQSATHIPGPGYYEINLKRKESNLPQSAFASKSGRSALNIKTEYPGPGTYNLDSRYNKNNNNNYSTSRIIKPLPIKLNSSIVNTKIVSGSKQDYPGPGAYNISSNSIPKHFMSSSVFLSNVPRWIMPNVPVALGIGDMVVNGGSVTCAGGIDAFRNPGPTKYNPNLPHKTSFHYNINNDWVY
ncbi:unnamed protein product [Heterobilharzia americana]|nr:unnamed protein product [Heterobilharzia americana]